MIAEYIRYQMPDSPAQERLIAAYRIAGKVLQASPHCLGFELTQCAEEAAVFILRIEWDSAEGHLKGFRTSPEFRTFYQAIAPFVANIAEMRHYDLTDVRWKREE